MKSERIAKWLYRMAAHAREGVVDLRSLSSVELRAISQMSVSTGPTNGGDGAFVKIGSGPTIQLGYSGSL